MSLAPSLFASPLVRERSGSISQSRGDGHAQSPFGGAPAPPMSSDRYGGGFSELRRRGGGRGEQGSGTPLGGNSLVASEMMMQTPASTLRGTAPRSSARGPPTASLLDDSALDGGAGLFSPGLALSPGAQPMELASPEGSDARVFSPSGGGRGSGALSRENVFSPRGAASRPQGGGFGFGAGGAVASQPSCSFGDENEKLRCWVVVFGFERSDDPKDVLRALGEYGEILEHEQGHGNWMFLRFATKWQAEKALAQTAIVIDGGSTVVGALRATPDVAARFGMHSNGSGNGTGPKPLSTAPKTSNDVMLHPKLRASHKKNAGCCERLMASLFSW